MDKFPEAFDRFENKISVDEIRSFRELTFAFGSWAGQKWFGTIRQVEALAVEARKRGIPVYGMRERKRAYYQTKTWTHETFTLRGMSQQRYRDLKTGRFIKKP